MLKRKPGGHFSHEHVCLTKVSCPVVVKFNLLLMNLLERPARKSAIFISKVTKNNNEKKKHFCPNEEQVHMYEGGHKVSNT